MMAEIEIRIGDHIIALVTREIAQHLVILSGQEPGRVTSMELSLDEPIEGIWPLKRSSLHHTKRFEGARVNVAIYFSKEAVLPRLHDSREERK